MSWWVDLEIPQELAIFLSSYFEMGFLLTSGEPLKLGSEVLHCLV